MAMLFSFCCAQLIMSKFIDEILEDIRKTPESWVRYGNDGLQKGDIIISQCGNGHKFFMGWATSIVEVTINGKDSWGKTTWRDKYRAEEAFLWWMRNASVKMLQA
jgi:hypothetical protein